jgi:hypothetical protein
VTRHVIRIVTDPANPEGGPLLAFYDPDAHGGAGEARTTTNPAQALSWPTAEGAVNCYRQTSTVRPRRPDGQPNRPLTVATVLFDTIEEP